VPAWVDIDVVAGVATGVDEVVVAVAGVDVAGAADPEDPAAESEAAEVLVPPPPLTPLLLPTRRR